MPRSHWTEAELDSDQGLNSKFYDPYTEYENVVRERTRSRKQAKKDKEKGKDKEKDKEGEAKSKKASKKEADEDGEECIEVPSEQRQAYEDDLDEMTKHHKEILEKVCEPKEDFERYKLWPGDPGVCKSVEDLLTTIAKHVCNNCLSADSDSTAYGTDNMTVTIVLFRNSTLGRAVYKRYPQKSEGTSSLASSSSVHHRRSMSSASGDSDSAIQPLSDGDAQEYRGSSSGSPGRAGVVPHKVNTKSSTTQLSEAADSASSTPPIESGKKHKHKKHSKHHRAKVDLTAPMSDAEKMVYQFADDFSDDDVFVSAPQPPASK